MRGARAAAAAPLCCALLPISPAQGAAHTAIVYEDPAFIAKVQASLTSEWNLVPLTRDLSRDVLDAAEAVFGDVPAELLPALPKLQMYQAVGHASPLEDRAHPGVPNGTKVCRGNYAGGAIGALEAPTIAEWCVASVFEMVFRTGRVDAQMRDCAWSEAAADCPKHSVFGTRPSLMNMTLGIVGYGKVGQNVARMAAPLVKEVVASDPYATGPAPAPLTSWTTRNDDVIQAADVLVLSFADHIPATVGLFNKTAFGLMKQGAYLVMFVGGAGVDEQAAFDNAKSGRLRGLAVNQWWERYAWRGPKGYAAPDGGDWWAPPSSLPFDQLGNVVMSPNACMKSEQYWDGQAAVTAANLDLIAAGQEPCP